MCLVFIACLYSAVLLYPKVIWLLLKLAKPLPDLNCRDITPAVSDNPFISRYAVGDVVPIPMLPPLAIRSRSVPLSVNANVWLVPLKDIPLLL